MARRLGNQGETGLATHDQTLRCTPQLEKSKWRAAGRLPAAFHSSAAELIGAT
jgi:hypothetical protein